jgi:hypothetical protein
VTNFSASLSCDLYSTTLSLVRSLCDLLCNSLPLLRLHCSICPWKFLPQITFCLKRWVSNAVYISISSIHFIKLLVVAYQYWNQILQTLILQSFHAVGIFGWFCIVVHFHVLWFLLWYNNHITFFWMQCIFAMSAYFNMFLVLYHL